MKNSILTLGIAFLSLTAFSQGSGYEFAQSCYRQADIFFFKYSQSDKALKLVNDGLKASPGFKDLEILEAIILGADDKSRDAALEKYIAVSQKHPNDVRLNLHYAKFLENFDALSAAAQYEKVVAADPKNRDAFISLGAIYNNEALKIPDPTEVYTLVKKSASNFEKARALNPADKELTGILVQLYSELGQPEKEMNVPF